MVGIIRAGLSALLLLFATLCQAMAGTAPFRLCADPHNPPLSSDTGSAPGIYIELGRDIAAALGRPFDAVWTPHLLADAGAKLRAGDCDGVIGLPDYAGLAGAGVILSHPFLSVGFALVTPPAMAAASLADLDGKRVAVQFGSPAQSMLAQDSRIDMVTVVQPLEGLHALANGKADAALLWGPSSGWINHSQLHDAYKIKPVAGDRLRWKVVIGFASTHADLRDAVDHALAGLGDKTQALEAKYGVATDAPIVLAGGATPQQAAPKATAASASPAKADAKEVAAGHSLFNANCEHCHGFDAIQGLEVRNLRHLHKRYGDKMDQVFLYTVTHGRPTQGMPNWSGILTTAQFHDILAWLHTIQEP